MRTLVISDLHLGSSSGCDLLRRAELRAPLIEALEGIDRLVILGDVLELREVPVRRAADHAEEALQDIGNALGPDGELVLVGGNHDHGLVAPWLDARLYDPDGSPGLGLEQRFTPAEAGPLAQRLAEAAGPVRTIMAYPGIHLRPDVYAIHGHYSDLHTTVPTFERLAAGAMNRFAARVPDAGATPDDYEAVLAPLYAWMLAHAQRDEKAIISAGAGFSARAWETLTKRDGRTNFVKYAGLSAAYVAAIALVNQIGLGPIRGDLSGKALRQGGLHGMREAIRRLGIDVPHVIWGHSHRAGPFPDDDRSEWTTPQGTRLHNTGSWTYQRHFLSGGPNESPYWPGTAIVVGPEGPPVLRRLLGDRGHAQLAPPPA